MDAKVHDSQLIYISPLKGVLGWSGHADLSPSNLFQVNSHVGHSIIGKQHGSALMHMMDRKVGHIVKIKSIQYSSMRLLIKEFSIYKQRPVNYSRLHEFQYERTKGIYIK